MAAYKVSVFDYKVLITILNCNKNNDFPNAYGVYKILKGIQDEETLKYVDSETFSTSISITSKKVSMRVAMLLRYNFVSRIYDATSDELFLKLTPLGESKAKSYLFSHKVSLQKKTKKVKLSITHINSEDLSK